MVFSYKEQKELISKYYPYLKSKEVDVFLSITKYESYSKKDIILNKGRRDKKIFIILKGSARSYTIVNGIELNCHLRSEGFLMGDAKSFNDDPVSLLYTEAITDIQLLMFDLGELETMAFKNPALMTFYIKLMKEIITVFSHRIETFVTMNSEERYIDLIQWNPNYLESTYDKHIASFLGITPLTLHRIKKKQRPIK